MRKSGLHIAFLVIILLMALPFIQSHFPLFSEKPLNGAFELSNEPGFSRDSWFTGEYQGKMEQYLKDHSGFRNSLIRMQNQLDFMVFRQANAEGAIVGKNNQLYEYDYIRSWLALDYPGDSFVEKKLQRTKYIQDYLKREKGIDLVIVFEPGKASFYPEYIPNRFSSMKKGSSTYERYQLKAEELGIEYIDFHQYFLNLKGKTEYPLYPRYGTHWSVYGMWYAADSLLNFIERIKNIEMTDVYVDSLVLSNKPLDTDDDVLKTMNLPCPPKSEILAYPKVNFDTAHPGEKPSVLVVADSYYWNMFNTDIPKYLFANQAFWYFNTLVYPDHYFQPSYTKDLNLKEEVEKQDLIFLMITERFVHKFDWMFIDNLYALYTPEWLTDPVYDKINHIMQVESWYELMINKAANNNLHLEDILVREGKYLLSIEDTLAYLINYGPEHFSKVIENEQNWMHDIRQKAHDLQISEYEMLNKDALYIFEENFPEHYKLNRGMSAIEERIYSDQNLYDSLKIEADAYRWGIDSFIRLKAWQLYREEQIQQTMNTIRSDPAWLEHVEEKAYKRGIQLDQMIRMDAEYMWEQRLNKFRPHAVE